MKDGKRKITFYEMTEQNKKEYYMNQHIQTKQYDALIKKIQHKRRWIIALTVIAVWAVLIFTLPSRLEIMGETVIDYQGQHPVLIILMILLCFFVGAVAFAIVSAPLTTSMDIECNPKKHLILNIALNKQKNNDHICAVDFIYMGNFEEALNYANKMIASNKPTMMITGLFNKARCEFFLGDFDSLKATVKQYESALNNLRKVNQKAKDSYNKILKAMNLMVAIAEEDKEGISNFSSIDIWNNSKATQGYINYLRGVAAYITENKKEAIYRFMSVIDNCENTVFSGKAQQYLSKLSADS